jgi:hypothetical protein
MPKFPITLAPLNYSVAPRMAPNPSLTLLILFVASSKLVNNAFELDLTEWYASLVCSK